MFSHEELEIVALSLRIALTAVVVSLPLAVACAWLLARKDFWGKALFDAAIHLPLVLPPVVIGYFLLIMFGRNGPAGAWLYDQLGIVFAFRWTGAALAAGVMGFPLMVRAIRLAIENVPVRLEMAACTLGASAARVLFTVTLPLAGPGVAVGMLLAFARCLGEFGATITFVSNIPGETQTLPLAIYALTQTPQSDAAILKLCAVSVAISLLALAGSEWLARRSKAGRTGLTA